MRDRSFIRILALSLFTLLGMLLGVLIVPAVGGDGIQYVIGAGGLILAIIFIISARSYLQRDRGAADASGGGKEGTQVGFVVDAFNDLVAQLKEKEKELERLKAFAEEKAVRMEAYNENILQSVPSGVISLDNSMTIKSINHAAARILGINSENALDKGFSEVFREPLKLILSEEGTVSRVEYPYSTDDGRHIWLGITTSQLKNSAGEKIGMIIVFTDLTDIKALQTQVELKERLSQLGEMSAGISHELRNSMSVISGYAKLLGRKAEGQEKGTVEAIQAEIVIMNRIISELLAFAKPTVLNRGNVSINDLLRETSAAAVGDADNIRVSITASKPVQVDADLVLLRQAFTNLFTNAAEAMPEGGTIDVSAVSSPGKAEIIIKDSGHGVPEDIRQKIFLPFFTTKEKGTGFGLALVQKIIVSHGGSIDVESGKGAGAAFRITLPASD